MSELNKIIRKEQLDLIPRIVEIASCSHEWKESGFGYQCKHCGYYTGTYTTLNELIKKELKK